MSGKFTRSVGPWATRFVLPMETALDAGEGGESELDAGGGVEQNALERGGCESCFVFASWLIRAWESRYTDLSMQCDKFERQQNYF